MTGNGNGNVQNEKLARGLETQARELMDVASRMQQAARMLHGLRSANRLSPEGRAKISRAARRRWAEHRRRVAEQERAVKAKQRKSGNQKV